MKTEAKGNCKHGEFILDEGCQQCIDESCYDASVEKQDQIQEKDNTNNIEPTEDNRLISEMEIGIQPQTAMIKIDPEKDSAVAMMLDEVSSLKKYADKLIIKNDDDVKAATNDLTIISGLKKKISEKQKEYINPIKLHIDNIKEAFNLLLIPLNEADKLTRDKILDYRNMVRKLEEAKRQQAELEAKLSGEPEVAPVPIVEERKHYRSDIGTTGIAQIWKWEIEDFAKLPDMYKIPDSTKIGKVIRGGGSIPGVRAWQEDSLRITQNRG